jgi:integrase
VFHREGRPIGDFHRVWSTACEEAGLPGLLFHDFRRSAVRNMGRSGRVRPAVAMRITGHETDSMWRRYRIVDESDIEQALGSHAGVRPPAGGRDNTAEGRRDPGA